MAAEILHGSADWLLHAWGRKLSTKRCIVCVTHKHNVLEANIIISLLELNLTESQQAKSNKSIFLWAQIKSKNTNLNWAKNNFYQSQFLNQWLLFVLIREWFACSLSWKCAMSLTVLHDLLAGPCHRKQMSVALEGCRLWHYTSIH